MHHLHRVSSFPHLNNMPSSNLGIVFGPTLLRTSEGSASLSSLVDTVHQTRAIELLITFAHEIFPQSEILQSRDLQVPSGAASARVRLDEVLKQPLPSRQTSVHTSSSSSSSSSSGVNVSGVSGHKRGRDGGVTELVGVVEDSPSPAPSHAHKDRKDSENLDEDWEWEGEESSTEAGGSEPATPRPPAAAARAPSSHAKIYKTSLKDYVGLEGVEVRTSSGVTKTESRGSVTLEQGAAGMASSGGRKVSPLLGQRSSHAHRSGLASGTDSSIDSDYSYEYSQPSAAGAAPTCPSAAHASVLAARGRNEVMAGGASRAVSVSRDPSLDNVTSSVTSSDSSSQELDSAHATEDSHSSEAYDETDAAHARPLAYSSGCGGSSGGESGYVSPYLSTERGGLVTLGPSLLLTRATIAQYDTKRTITTVVAPKSSFDENRVRIQVPAAAVAAAAAGGGATRTVSATGGGGLGAEATVTVSRSGPQEIPRQDTGGDDDLSSSHGRLQPESRASSQHPTQHAAQEHPRKPSPNRAPRFV
ncbi:suppressor protein SRP40-like isoform X2 [Penaeus chinensis]|uniref:suppressor protein SRP40-like isoform X2 n=1 Tax=Penaeus chinensis TaxID=139456 RepID=UPI001FB5CAD5|nr:suppressor protein SRP40-like isoform X2 [Penaeus chinensis]